MHSSLPSRNHGQEFSNMRNVFRGKEFFEYLMQIDASQSWYGP